MLILGVKVLISGDYYLRDAKLVQLPSSLLNTGST